MADRDPLDAELAFEDLEIAPEDPSRRAPWLDQLLDWRQSARRRFADPSSYSVAESGWTTGAFVCAMVMLWDADFYDPMLGEFLVEEYLDRAEGAFGALDVVVLWHAYPRIGFDERNQFDFYRDLPGGLEALAGIVERLHARGCKAILDYNPWDTGTRREALDDDQSLAQIVAAVGADGIFLDTMANASPGLGPALAEVDPGIVFESEFVVPLPRVADHLMSWVQWPSRLDQRLVLRNKWFEQRHMQHLVRRWHDDHHDELICAWLNGAGVVVWENVFGSIYPWNARDRQLLLSISRLQRALAELLSGGRWVPFVATSDLSLDASRFDSPGVTFWAVANRGPEVLVETSITDALPPGSEAIDLLANKVLGRGDAVVVPPGGIAAVIVLDETAPADYRSAARRLGQEMAGTAVVGAQPVPEATRRRPVGRSAGSILEAGMRQVPSGRRHLEAVFRRRECGDYERATLANQVFPDLSGEVVVPRSVNIGQLAIDVGPVTNDEFQVFLRSSGYQPRQRHRFLDHWIGGAPRRGEGGLPVTYVDLNDARAYAAFIGRRLPTEDEWQVGLSEALVGHGDRRVWEWTESEHFDGHNRFVILKGGSDRAVEGSDWYAESGPLEPNRSAKFILFAPGIDRCSTVGFRCALDLAPDQRATRATRP